MLEWVTFKEIVAVPDRHLDAGSDVTSNVIINSIGHFWAGPPWHMLIGAAFWELRWRH